MATAVGSGMDITPMNSRFPNGTVCVRNRWTRPYRLGAALTIALLPIACAGGETSTHDTPAVLQPPTGDTTGVWDIFYIDETVAKDSLTLAQSGNDLTGSWYGATDGETWPIQGTIDGSHVLVSVLLPVDSTHLTIDAQLQGDAATLQGSWIVVGAGSMDGTYAWRATKRP